MADSKDFGLLNAKKRYVAVAANSLTGTDEVVTISAPLHGICGGRYIDTTKLIGVAFPR
jgi:hypothetical protein